MPNKFDVVLTGTPDGLSDFTYTLKSFNGIHYSGLTSHLYFQLPRQFGDIQAILDRPNGEIVLRKNSIELFRSVPINIDFYEGATNKTFSISASYVATETTPETIELPVEKIDYDIDGKRRIKIAGNHIFKPLDSLLYDEEEIQIDQVIVNISIDKFYMMLRELWIFM